MYRVLSNKRFLDEHWVNNYQMRGSFYIQILKYKKFLNNSLDSLKFLKVLYVLIYLETHLSADHVEPKEIHPYDSLAIFLEINLRDHL